MEDTWIIVGLGNPGRKYEMTRHNIGFVAVEELAHRHHMRINKTKFKGLYGEGSIAGNKIILAKPQTYMNNSGECVRELMDWYKISLDRLLVIYDDIDIPAGTIRIREKGSAGTHNGMRSIIYHLNEDGFPRLRIGIGKPEYKDYDLAGYVLEKFPKEQHQLMFETVVKGADAAERIIRSGTAEAMNKYNRG